MKKLWIIILVIFLYGCQPSEKLSIMVPQGSPQLATLGLDDDRYDMDVVLGADPLVAAFGSMSHDAIIAPTNLGAKLYQSKPSYILAATLVWGNYYLISSSFDTFSIDQLEGQSIVVFGQNQTSDIILKHLLQQYEIDATFTYVDSVTAASSLYISDPSLIVLVAEPSFSIIKKLIPETKSMDIQELYANIHDQTSYPQASLFIRSDLHPEQVSAILEDIESSITWVNSREGDVLERGVSLGLADNRDVLTDAIIGSHIIYQSAQEAKESCNTYLRMILSFNPQLIGGKLPDDGFYWSDVE